MILFRTVALYIVLGLNMVSRAMRLRTFLIFLITLGIFAGLSERVHAQNIWLSDLPSIENGHYKVDPYIKAAEQLQRMGRHAAIQQLYGLAHSADTWHADSDSDVESKEKTVILCRMLFTNRPGSALERPAFLGAAFFYGEDLSLETTSYTNWPDEPIELIDGLPFAIAYGHSKRGLTFVDPHEAESYVQYCITNGVWTSYHFTQKSDAAKREALKKLIASPKWRQPLKPWEREHLTAEIQPDQPAPSALPLTPGPLSGKFLEEALRKVDPWPAGSTNYSEANWKQLCFVARVIQKSSPRTVSNALREYQGLLVYQGTERPFTMEELDNDSKVFLLMRVVFDLPERAPDDNRMVGFWITMRTEINADGSINRAWPIAWNNGSPRLISGARGASGFRYSAADEFLSFKDKYRFRDLSSLKLGF